MIREAIILSGGRGTRLQAVVSDRPKPMALVEGRPFVEWLILALRRQGVERVVLAAGHLAEVIENHFQGRGDFGVEIFVMREQEPLGTGGAARNALSLLKDDVVAILNGDSYCPFTLTRLQQDATADACLTLVQVDDCSRFGTVEVDASGRVLAFREKAGLAVPGLINAGVYSFSRDVVADVPSGRAVSMERDVLPQVCARGRLRSVISSGPFCDIGTPESYASVGAALGQVLGQLLKAA